MVSLTMKMYKCILYTLIIIPYTRCFIKYNPDKVNLVLAYNCNLKIFCKN